MKEKKWLVQFDGYTHGPYPWKEAREIYNIAIRRGVRPHMWEAYSNVHNDPYCRL